MCYFVVLKSSLLSKLEKCEGLLALREKQYKELGMETRDFAIAELTQLKNTIADIKNDLATHQYHDNLKDD